MNSAWIRGVPNDKKKERQDLVKSHVAVIDALKEILEKEKDVLTVEMRSNEEYNSPTWAYKQADYMGALRTYDHIIEILTLDRGEK